MTAPVQTHREETPFAGAPGEAACILEPFLLAVAGRGTTVLSVAYDYGPPDAAAGSAVAEAWIERTTRSLVFAHARLIGADGVVLASCSAVLRNATEA